MVTEWIPGISRQDFKRDGGAWTRQPVIICLHSTETGSWPGYQSGATAPHFTIDPRTGAARQHIPLTRAARALEHPRGTPETNRAGVIQIEIIGSADLAFSKKHGYLFMPSLTQAQLSTIGALVAKIRAAVPGVPLASTVDWVHHPRPGYGAGYPRLTTAQFSTYRGILGHQHVPNNSHGDPGALNVAAMIKGISPAPPKPPAPAPSKDDEMPTPNEIAKAIWAYPVPRPGNTPVNAGSQLGSANVLSWRNDKTLKALTKTIDAMAAVILAPDVAAIHSAAIATALDADAADMPDDAEPSPGE